MTNLPKPFLKWVGGKSRSADAILDKFPYVFDTYYEPFLGGGAVFFALLRSNKQFKRAVLSDINCELITTYRAIRDNVEAVIAILKTHRYEKDHYYWVRSQDPAEMTDHEKAARTIYLNKTGFNGLYRVNKKGEFNVPFGRYTNPMICDESTLRAASEALRSDLPHVDLLECNYDWVMRRPTKGEVVYCDPPYIPTNKTSNFTSYDVNGFTIEDQANLARSVMKAVERGAFCVVSNSYTGMAMELYSGFEKEELKIGRTINSDATSRDKVSEMLFWL